MGASEVSFTNSYGQRLFVAYMRLDWACGDDCGDPWDVRGWVALEPGQSQSRENPTDNRWYYYYAEAVDGAVWAGRFVAEVRQAAFHKCRCLAAVGSGGSPLYHDVGFCFLDTDEFSGVNFRPP